MEYKKQESFESYMDDFRFHINTQGSIGKSINTSYHSHEFIEILYGIEETVQVIIENTEYQLKAGDMLLIGPNVIHATRKRTCEPGYMYNIAFDPDIIRNVNYCSLESRCISSFLKYLSSFEYHYIESEKLPGDVGVLFQKINECYYSYKEYNCIYIRAYLLEMIGMLCEKGFFETLDTAISKPVVEAITETLEYMKIHYNEKITLADMAKRANLSYYYYSKLFKEIVGKNFSDFLASVRIFAAEKMMVDGENSLQEIAVKVGLFPQSTFNHTYKRLRGFSPNEFIKRLKNCN